MAEKIFMSAAIILSYISLAMLITRTASKRRVRLFSRLFVFSAAGALLCLLIWGILRNF